MVAVVDGDKVWVGDGEREGDREGEGDGEGVGDGVAVADADAVAVATGNQIELAYLGVPGTAFPLASWPWVICPLLVPQSSLTL